VREYVKSDERILCDSDFVQLVLSAQNEQLEACYRLQAQGYDLIYDLISATPLSALYLEGIQQSHRPVGYRQA